jgi:nitrate/nitrite transporter NarK
LPNVLLILVGGIFVDRFGAARMTLCTAAVCFVGAAIRPLTVGTAYYRF